MIADIITKKIIYSTPTRMALKGGVQANNEVIPTIATELREFLMQHKGTHIGKEELEEFYKKYFPQAKLNIIDGKSQQYRSSKVKAECSVSYTDDMKDIEEFQIFIQSKTFMDKIKFLFDIQNRKKPFYVDNDFIKFYIHEYVHFMQRYLKPIDKTTHFSISSNTAFGSDNFIHIKNDINIADKGLVYRGEGNNFFPETFRKNLMAQLNNHDYSTNILAKDELKFLIRHAQAEKQAFEIDMEEAAWAKHPKLMKNKYFKAFIRAFNKNLLKKHFRFEDKIRIMKEEYFRLISQEREKIRTYQELFKSPSNS